METAVETYEVAVAVANISVVAVVMLSRYNSELRLSTLRWAVLAQLRKPPPGLEDVVKGHFR